MAARGPTAAATAAVSVTAQGQAAAPTAAAMAAAVVTAQGQAAAATPSAVVLRDWRRVAQRTVRLALTATRTAWSGFNDASEEGHAALAGLADTLILLVQLPGMALGALQDVEGLRQAAARKLVGRHWAQWRQLADACDAMDACVQSALQQCLEVERLTAPDDNIANSASLSPLQQQQQGTTPSAAAAQEGLAGGTSTAPAVLPWQARVVVFSGITAPRCAQLLREVWDMLRREAEVRRGICTLLAPSGACHPGDVQGSPAPQSAQHSDVAAGTSHSLDANADAATQQKLQPPPGLTSDAAHLRSSLAPGSLQNGAQQKGLVAELVEGSLALLGLEDQTSVGLAVTQLASSSGGSSASRKTQAATQQQQQELRGVLTVHLSTWLAAPFLNQERSSEIIEVLVQDMAGH